MSSPERIPTNLRMLLILEVLGLSDQPMTATEINEAIGLPKQTVHRLCDTLEQHGFISKVGQSKRYQATRRLREFGLGLLHNSREYIARRQILTNLANQVGETINFVVPEEGGMRYLDRVETDWAFRIQLPIGTNVPFHCTASGKCFLASLSAKQQRDIVNNLSFSKMTSHTHQDADSLLLELKDIKKDGYALDQEEFIDGMVALAVPVLDTNGRFGYSLAMHGPTQRLTIDILISQVGAMQNAAHKIHQALFVD